MEFIEYVKTKSQRWEYKNRQCGKGGYVIGKRKAYEGDIFYKSFDTIGLPQVVHPNGSIPRTTGNGFLLRVNVVDDKGKEYRGSYVWTINGSTQRPHWKLPNPPRDDCTRDYYTIPQDTNCLHCDHVIPGDAVISCVIETEHKTIVLNDILAGVVWHEEAYRYPEDGPIPAYQDIHTGLPDKYYTPEDICHKTL